MNLKDCKNCDFHEGTEKSKAKFFDYVLCQRSNKRIEIEENGTLSCPVDKVTKVTKYYTKKWGEV